MRRLALRVAMAILVCAFAIQARAQEKTARGTVTASTATSLTMKVAGTDMTFTVDSTTTVEAPGAATAARRAEAAGRGGLKLADVIKPGTSAEVTYTESGGARHATKVRRVSSAGGGPADATSSSGKVTAVSATSLTISGSGGGGSTFTQTFIIDPNTRVVGKGAGTAAARGGGKVPIIDLVAVGDSVTVSFRRSADTLHATSVTVTMKAPRATK
jgi:uncharacterized protein DUF5666